MATENLPVIHVAIPAYNEADYIPTTIHCLQKQDISGFHTWVCVNQPDEFHRIPEKKSIIENNKATLRWLKTCNLRHLHIIDRSSPGKGWKDCTQGVGMARKVLMDQIAQNASDHDVILSMDADTVFSSGYIRSISEIFLRHPKASGLSNPYYHLLIENNEAINRAMLRYEIYLRYYALNMRFTGSPYHFTPLGSAMAAPVWSYRKINGMTPKKSGEDFYFLQKIVKSGVLLKYNHEIVYPATRLSDRVFFGTGPALIKGIQQGWDAYPLFHLQSFEKVKKTISLFPQLIKQLIPTPMNDFFRKHFNQDDIFAPLRKNHKDELRFINACHEKVDGLRILQFLKTEQPCRDSTDEQNLMDFFLNYFPHAAVLKNVKNLNFLKTDVETINKIRNFLFERELEIQRKNAGY